MKTRFIAILAAVLAFQSCGRMVDWVPVNLIIEVYDSSGRDLLDPATGNTWLEGTTITFRGETEPLQLEPATKYYMPQFYGFRLKKGDGNYQLEYGEIDGEIEYRDEPFTIRWGDGSEDIISLTRRLNYISISAKTKWKLNGNKTSSPIVITKDIRTQE